MGAGEALLISVLFVPCPSLHHLVLRSVSAMTLLVRPISPRLPRLFATSKRYRSTSNLDAAFLLSPRQAHEISDREQTVLLDASWFLPNSPRNPHAEFLAKRLPNAQFLDLDQVATPHELGLKHMMPEPHVFAEAMGMLHLGSL